MSRKKTKRAEPAPRPAGRGIRYALFRVVLLLPAAVVLFFAGAFAKDVIALRSIDDAEISRNLDTYLRIKKGSEFGPPPGFFELQPDEDAVFLFGESSVVLSDKLVFAQYLGQDLAPLNPKLRIVNFGISGIDSFSIKRRVEQALQNAKVKPKLLLFYYGHNDCHAAYKSVVNGPKAPYGNLFDTFLKMSFYLSGGAFDSRDQEHVFGTKKYEFFWYGLYHRPRYFNFAQKLGLWKIDNALYQDYNRRIHEQFKKHTAEIVALSRASGVPALFVTPIGNLHAKPYGAVDVVEENFRLGLASTDYRKSFEYLSTARDNEIFTGDLRAKSPLLDFLRTLGDGSTTFVLDLEKDFAGQQFRFDDENFLDYFHFNDRGHQAVGRYLSGKMREIPRIREVLRLPAV